MNTHADNLIDQTLQALRDTEVPTGLEARIAARLAQSAEARTTAAPSFFAVILNAVKDPRILFAEAIPFAWATIALILAAAAISSTFLVRHHDQTIAQWNPTTNQPTETSTQTQASPTTKTQVARIVIRPLDRPHIPTDETVATAPDLDAIALAETRASSHPAPPMPMTAQEVLLFRSTRQGQPIELAELDALRDTNLRSIAQSRDRASLRNYIQSLLAPLAAAQALTPTSPSPDDAQPTTPPDPPTSK